MKRLWYKLRCRLGWHTRRMRYMGSPKGEGRASGSTHFVLCCKHCPWMEYGGPS